MEYKTRLLKIAEKMKNKLEDYFTLLSSPSYEMKFPLGIRLKPYQLGMIGFGFLTSSIIIPHSILPGLESLGYCGDSPLQFDTDKTSYIGSEDVVISVASKTNTNHDIFVYFPNGDVGILDGGVTTDNCGSFHGMGWFFDKDDPSGYYEMVIRNSSENAAKTIQYDPKNWVDLR